MGNVLKILAVFSLFFLICSPVVFGANLLVKWDFNDKYHKFIDGFSIYVNDEEVATAKKYLREKEIEIDLKEAENLVHIKTFKKSSDSINYSEPSNTDEILVLPTAFNVTVERKETIYE